MTKLNIGDKAIDFLMPIDKENNIIRHAHFTKFIKETNIKDTTTNILVGAKETYIPVCRQCFLK